MRLAHNHRCTEIHSKTYSHAVLWKFAIEQVMDYGPNLICHLAARDQGDLERVRNQINNNIRGKRQIHANARALSGRNDPSQIGGWQNDGHNRLRDDTDYGQGSFGTMDGFEEAKAGGGDGDGDGGGERALGQWEPMSPQRNL